MLTTFFGEVLRSIRDGDSTRVRHLLGVLREPRSITATSAPIATRRSDRAAVPTTAA